MGLAACQPWLTSPHETTLLSFPASSFQNTGQQGW